MRNTLFFPLIALGAITATGPASAGDTWFDSERDAVHALSNGAALEVFECTQCDADNTSHRTTLDFIGHLLEELRDNDQPSKGAFLLRERIQPRFHLDDDLQDEQGETIARAARTGCDNEGWSPSLTRWDYDLDRDEARPVHSACLVFTEEPTPIRMSCKGCDLESLGQSVDIREQLEAAHWALFEDRDSVTSGVIIVTDSVNSGFRRLDFRAYPEAVYLGPADGDYYRIPLDRSKDLAQAP